MFFEFIYRWFASFFGGDLADYLSGFDCETTDYTNSNQFVMYGVIAFFIALAFVLIYYYLINHPRFNKWWHWGIMLLIVGVLNFLIGAIKTLSELDAGHISDCLVYGSNGGVSASNLWMFGLANLLVSVIFFILLSIGLKWWSTNCKRTPF